MSGTPQKRLCVSCGAELSMENLVFPCCDKCLPPAPPASPKADPIVPPELVRWALLNITATEVRDLFAAYFEAAYAMRRLELRLVAHNVPEKWVIAVRSRVDDWERNAVRHLTAIVDELKKTQTEESPDAR